MALRYDAADGAIAAAKMPARKAVIAATLMFIVWRC